MIYEGVPRIYKIFILFLELGGVKADDIPALAQPFRNALTSQGRFHKRSRTIWATSDHAFYLTRADSISPPIHGASLLTHFVYCQLWTVSLRATVQPSTLKLRNNYRQTLSRGHVHAAPPPPHPQPTTLALSSVLPLSYWVMYADVTSDTRVRDEWLEKCL
jgi:hypothetical protein